MGVYNTCKNDVYLYQLQVAPQQTLNIMKISISLNIFGNLNFVFLFF